MVCNKHVISNFASPDEYGSHINCACAVVETVVYVCMLRRVAPLYVNFSRGAVLHNIMLVLCMVVRGMADEHLIVINQRVPYKSNIMQVV